MSPVAVQILDTCAVQILDTCIYMIVVLMVALLMLKINHMNIYIDKHVSCNKPRRFADTLLTDSTEVLPKAPPIFGYFGCFSLWTKQKACRQQVSNVRENSNSAFPKLNMDEMDGTREKTYIQN